MDWGEIFWAFAKEFHFPPEVTRRLPLPVLTALMEEKYRDPTKPKTEARIIWCTSPEQSMEISRLIKNERNVPTR